MSTSPARFTRSAARVSFRVTMAVAVVCVAAAALISAPAHVDTVSALTKR